jgi:hypothetical protein
LCILNGLAVALFVVVASLTCQQGSLLTEVELIGFHSSMTAAIISTSPLLQLLHRSNLAARDSNRALIALPFAWRPNTSFRTCGRSFGGYSIETGSKTMETLAQHVAAISSLDFWFGLGFALW